MRAFLRNILEVVLVSAVALVFAGCSEKTYTLFLTFSPSDLAEDVDRVLVSLVDSCALVEPSLGSYAGPVSGQFELHKGQNLRGLKDVRPAFYGFYAIGFDAARGECRIAAGCDDHGLDVGGDDIIRVELVRIDPIGCVDAGTPDGGTPEDANVRPDVSDCVPTGSNETCNDADDDCDGEVDEDFSLPTNPERCGDCDNVCSEDQGCANGECAPRAVQLALGAEHSCALRADERVLCWGNNVYGQLGQGSFNAANPRPTLVPSLTNVKQVVAGGYTTCAALENGSARCWGDNDFGQVGDSTTSDSAVPRTVVGLANVDSLGPGPVHNCAVLGSGQVRCWGWNEQGELGNGLSGKGQESSTPVSVLNITNAVQVQGGYAFTCARTADGEMFCWGRNNYGQLGDGTTNGSSTPRQVQDLDDVTHFAVGGGHVCAVRDKGEIVCWGNGEDGQLSDRGGATSSVPVFTGISNGVMQTALNSESCALLDDGSVRCWAGVPTLVPMLNDAVEISMAYGDGHVCAIRENRNVACWGWNNRAGQMGNGLTETVEHRTPVTVIGL